MPSWLQLYHWLGDSRAFYAQQRALHGDVFTIRPFGVVPSVVFAHPAAVREILQVTPGTFGHANDLAQISVGTDSVILRNGDPHRLARRRLMPSFLGAPLHALGPRMLEATDEAIDALSPGEQVDFLWLGRRLTLHIIFRTLFGVGASGRYDALFREVLTLAEGAQDPFAMMAATVLPPGLLAAVTRGSHDGEGRRRRDPAWVVPLRSGSMVRANRRVRDMLLAHVRDVRAGRVEALPDSVFAQILRRADASDGPALGDDELVSELLTLLLAGHDTTAIALSWALRLLLHHESTWAALCNEVARSVAEHGALDVSAVDRLPYLDAAVRESMRLQPIVPAIARRALVDTVIAGVRIPAGVMVQALTTGGQHDEDLWPDARAFRPERMLDTSARPEALLPFGGGYRRCVGAAFATLELKLILARLAQRTELRLLLSEAPVPGRSGILAQPHGGAPVLVTARHPRETRSARPAHSSSASLAR